MTTLIHWTLHCIFVSDNMILDTLEVSGLEEEDEDVACLIFESKQRSGGGPLRDYRYFPSLRKAIISYEDPNGQNLM